MKFQIHPALSAKATRLAKAHVVLIAGAVFVVLLALIYALGFRVGPGLSINRVGTLTITNLPKGSSIYIDQVLNMTTAKAQSSKVELTPGTHTIIVSAPNDNPWSTAVTVLSGKEVVTNPILLALKPPVTLLLGDERTAALAAIASTILPTRSAPLILENGCARVYVENNQIIEDPATSTPQCVPPPYLCDNGVCSSTIIFSPRAPMDAVMKYPGRQDAIVVLLDHTLFALGLDPRNTQYFAPVAHGHHPTMGALRDGTIVAHDDNDTVVKISF